eukprot:c5525_g1_i1.p1 GENE.c5525_g1_i1~~c5525_g1_i1.p1  ORF type:complete len:704 (-),score=166.05 c5525_g1_i1:182-2188(-)
MQAQLNQACKKFNPNYSAMYVSWNDNMRNQGSALGPNITDARLKGKDGENFLVVRPQNFNEKIGKVKASEVAVLVGNHNSTDLAPVTLDTYLSRFGEYSSYANTPSSASLSASARDQKVGIRFQAVFLPVPRSHTNEATKEFFPETFNYQTRSKDDPKNVVLLCTSQGTFVQQDGPGNQAQYLHKRDNVWGNWNNHYLEAMETRHGVSMGQQETAEERLKALQAGKAVSTVIGIRSMGTGFNRLMTIQIPLRQKPVVTQSFAGMGFGGSSNQWSMSGMQPQLKQQYAQAMPTQLQQQCAQAMPTSTAIECKDTLCDFAFEAQQFDFAASAAAPSFSLASSSARAAPAQAHAARVSYGTVQGRMEGLKASHLNRDTDCSITITVQFYFVVEQNAIIQEQDIKKAIDVCEEAYSGCEWEGNLMTSNPNASFAKSTTQPATMIFPTISPTPTPGPTATTFPMTPVPTMPVQPFTIPPPPTASFMSASYSPHMGLPLSVAESVKQVPLTTASFAWFHDSIGLALLNQRTDLAGSFHGFRLANDVHINLTGTPSPTALYNMACVLSVVAEEQIKLLKQSYPFLSFSTLQQLTTYPAASVVAQNIPPALLGTSVGAVVQQRLEQSIMFLRMAVAAGYTQFAHMQTDSDFNCLRHFDLLTFQRVVDAAKLAATQK